MLGIKTSFFHSQSTVAQRNALINGFQEAFHQHVFEKDLDTSIHSAHEF